MQSPQSFTPQFQSHFYPPLSLSNHNSSHDIHKTENIKRSTENLFAGKEEKINNLMRVNLIFKQNIKLFYEFYCIQLYLSYEMINILKKLCIKNNMIDDIPSDQDLINGFMDIFVVPLFKFIQKNNNNNCYNYKNDKEIILILNDEKIKQELEINIYPIEIKTKIEDIAIRMAQLLIFIKDELKLNDDEKIFEYVDQYKSVKHHNKLKLKLLEYKSWLNGLCHRYHCCYFNVIKGYIRSSIININVDHVINEITTFISIYFYNPFGINKTNQEIKDFIYAPFKKSCNKPISLFLGSMIKTMMTFHIFLSTHSIQNKSKLEQTDLIEEEDWD